MANDILYIGDNHCDISIILLHGLGSSGKHFEPLARQIQALVSAKIRFVLPTAPIRSVKWALNRSVTAWYDLRNDDFLKDEDELGLLASAEFCQNLIQKEIDNGLSINKIFIGGFSQGGAVSLLSGLGFGEKLGGIFALSAYLPLAEKVVNYLKFRDLKTPIFLGHGMYDKIITTEQLAKGKKLLEAYQFPVNQHIYPIEHHISGQEIEDLSKWISENS